MNGRRQEKIGKGPFCEAFKCLLTRKQLEEGILPKWLTNLINWTMET